jgi:hypothetical protein
MTRNAASLLPEARSEGLLVQEVAGEVLVYDLQRDKAHRLNETAALIWRSCDGRTTIAAAAERLRGRHEGLDEDAIWLALGALWRAKLLTAAPAPAAPGVSRRQLAKRVGLAVLVPLIASMPVPAAAQAASCRGLNQLCTLSGQCCSGLICRSNRCLPPG